MALVLFPGDSLATWAGDSRITAGPHWVKARNALAISPVFNL
jgi:hypothetical protein